MIEVDIQFRRETFSLNAAFSADSEGIIAIFGRSGSGKTTLINLLAGLEKPNSGRISFDDTVLYDSNVGIDIPPEQRQLGYVFQDGRLFPHMTVHRNLVYGRRGALSHAEFETIVRLLDLDPLLDRRPGTLSGGEKQRVAIGRALLAQPKLLLMDEPLASLDAGRKSEILTYIERLREEVRLPIVYVSHSSDEIVRLADTLVLLSDGAVAAVGPLEDLMSRLDLRPLTGRYEAGAVIPTIVSRIQPETHLTELKFPGGILLVPETDFPVGHELRVRIRARDVSLALTPPDGISTLNILRGTVTEIGTGSGPLVDVLVDIGRPIWARISRHALQTLSIEVGKEIYAMIKAVAFDRRSLGYGAAQRISDEAG